MIRDKQASSYICCLNVLNCTSRCRRTAHSVGFGVAYLQALERDFARDIIVTNASIDSANLWPACIFGSSAQ